MDITYPGSRLKGWLHQLNSAVPSRISPLILRNQAESGAHLFQSSLRFPLRFPSEPLSCVVIEPAPGFYKVTQSSADGRESVGLGPNFLKVALSTGAADLSNPMAQIISVSRPTSAAVLMQRTCV